MAHHQPKNKLITPGIKTGQIPPFHKLDFGLFEELCRDLLFKEPNIATSEIYGDAGQSQNGIDIIAKREAEIEIEVGQCKCYKDFQPRYIKLASAEFFKHWKSHWSNEDVVRFILFVACEMKTKQRQDEIRNQEKVFKKYRINYEVWSAATIRNKLRSHPSIVSTYLHPPEYWQMEICGIIPPKVQINVSLNGTFIINAQNTYPSYSCDSKKLKEREELHRELGQIYKRLAELDESEEGEKEK